MGIREHEKNLQLANDAVFGKEAAIRGTRYRQRYHLMPPAGWMNDPNGFIHYKGLYHLFYQHYPFAPVWGEMHWGHAVSEDLVHWRHLPVALAPSESYDSDERGGCFSGSAVDDNGTLALLYTGTSRNGRETVQRQCLAHSPDGIHFTKYEGNPVIAAPPADGSMEFRDPKVWQHDGKWYMVAGSCRENRGKALLYSSPDLKRWEYLGVLAQSRGELGTMWECPDLFPLGGRYALLFSPMGLGDRKALYLTGSMDYRTGRFFYSTMGEADWGFDFYAPQTCADDKGRRVMIGWANSWDWMPWWDSFGPAEKDGWCGAMSLPRTVKLCRDGKLRFAPVEELKSLRREERLVSECIVADGEPLPLCAGDGVSYEIEAEIDLTETDAAEVGFALRCSETEKTLVTCDLRSAKLTVDRSASGAAGGGARSCPLESVAAQILTLHIFVDTCSVEIFTDEGRTVQSCNIYPSQGSTGLFFFSKGGRVKVCAIHTWGLASIW